MASDQLPVCSKIVAFVSLICIWFSVSLADGSASAWANKSIALIGSSRFAAISDASNNALNCMREGVVNILSPSASRALGNRHLYNFAGHCHKRLLILLALYRGDKYCQALHFLGFQVVRTGVNCPEIYLNSSSYKHLAAMHRRLMI